MTADETADCTEEERIDQPREQRGEEVRTGRRVADRDGDVTAGPNLLTAVLLAGLVYPLLFGAVGGLVGGHLSAE